MQEIIKKEIENMDTLIQNLEYELNEIEHTEEEKN